VLASARARLLFGVRFWASVCLALFVAFWLQLDSPFWAGTSAAVVCQPQLGASLRKGWFRMIGTVIGSVAIVGFTACFRQDRIGFFRAAGPVGRTLRVRCHGAAQLRILRGLPRRLHGRDRRPALFVFVHHRSLVLDPDRLTAELVMTATTEVASKHGRFAPEHRNFAGSRIRAMPSLVTLAVVALAGLIGWAAWSNYMGRHGLATPPCVLISSQWLRRSRGGSSSCRLSTTATFASVIS
jgi:hypothetical protein